MNTLVETVRLLSLGAWGVFAGAMLTEACLLVPWWRSIPATQFLAWYARNDRRLLQFFSPLTITTALLALASGILTLWTGHPHRWLDLAAALAALLVVGAFYAYFGKANASLSAGHFGETELAAELTRWAAWHWSRTCLSFVALFAMLAGR